VFDGADSTETVTSDNIKAQVLATIALIRNSATSDVTYWFKPRGLRQMFGDALPIAHSIFVVHNTGVNLNSTGSNHAIYHTPVYATVT
jgi:hypothetical protein